MEKHGQQPWLIEANHLEISGSPHLLRMDKNPNYQLVDGLFHYSPIIYVFFILIKSWQLVQDFFHPPYLYNKGYLYLRTHADFAGMDVLIHDDDIVYTYVLYTKYFVAK